MVHLQGGLAACLSRHPCRAFPPKPTTETLGFEAVKRALTEGTSDGAHGLSRCIEVGDMP